MALSRFFTGPLYQRMSDDLHLAGVSKRTHDGYLRAVRQLADYCQATPDKITEDGLRQFFLHLKNERHFASGSLRVAYSGIKFFYTRTCRRDWQTLAHMKIQNVKSLPEVLTIPQVHRIIGACTTERVAVYFWTVYSMGLRLEEGLNFPASAWRGKWVVDIEKVGDGQAVLKYLAPYVYRVAISDSRIVACDDQSVTFCYTPSGEKQSRTRRVTGHEFVRGFVQHVLPRGYQKVRYYGWMSPNSRIDLDKVKWLVWLFLGWTYWLGSGHAPPEKVEPQAVRCAACGGSMKIIWVVHFDCRVLVEHSLDYLDSG